jgi:hypothetical protein
MWCGKYLGGGWVRKQKQQKKIQTKKTKKEYGQGGLLIQLLR